MNDATSEPNPENTADDEVLAEQAAKPAFEEVYASESAYTPAAWTSTRELNGVTEGTAG